MPSRGFLMMERNKQSLLLFINHWFHWLLRRVGPTNRKTLPSTRVWNIWDKAELFCGRKWEIVGREWMDGDQSGYKLAEKCPVLSKRKGEAMVSSSAKDTEKRNHVTWRFIETVWCQTPLRLSLGVSVKSNILQSLMNVKRHTVLCTGDFEAKTIMMCNKQPPNLNIQ